MNRMTFLRKRLFTRSLFHVFTRVCTILGRYGLSSRKYLKSLRQFADFINYHHITPTFPLTATILKRNPNIFKEFQHQGIEFAIHGFRHVDYTDISKEITKNHIKQAIETFQKADIKIKGFRYPFLRRNEDIISLLRDLGLEWDSSEVISWNVLNQKDFTKKRWQNYQKILATYEIKDADQIASLPHLDYGLVEIPVSVPDDDILVERLGIKNQMTIGTIWMTMLKDIHLKGEMLTIQLHPERFLNCKDGLKNVIEHAQSMGDVWITSLNKISKWWLERNNIRLTIHKQKGNCYHGKLSGSDRVQLCLRDSNESDWREITVDKKNEIKITSPVKPMIGIKTKELTLISKTLSHWGYIYEKADPNESYAVVIDDYEKIKNANEETILEKIDKSPYPVLKIGRWPYKNKCCLAVTGDIDGINIRDFWERFYGKNKA
jgi:peptidoglycan/xylan/chitin deacetylase (PgdA/CDA1 family)